MKVLTQNRERILSINDSTNVSIGADHVEGIVMYYRVMLNFNAFYELGCYKGEERAKRILCDIFGAIKSGEDTFEMPIE